MYQPYINELLGQYFNQATEAAFSCVECVLGLLAS